MQHSPLAQKTLTISAAPSWVPAALLKRLTGQRLRCSLSKVERRIFRKRKPTTCSKWNQDHRVVVGGPLEGSRWKNETTPYLAGIMDASFFKGVEIVIICAGPQTGKSAAADGCLYYTMDRAPGPTLSIYPDQNLCRKNSKDRLQKTITKSPKLRSLITGAEDDLANLRIQLRTMVLYMGWAGSTSSISSDSIRYLKMDELDKWPEFPDKKEAASWALAEARTTTFERNRKIWKLSTPTVEAGPIWQALTKEAQVIFEYFVKCPECGKSQCMVFGGKDIDYGIKWPEDERDPETIEAKKLAWYVCEHCHGHWADFSRDMAVRGGQWRAKNDGRELFEYLRAERPKKIGFHIPSWLSRFVSLSKVAAAFLKGAHDKAALKDFCNKHKAEPWLEFEAHREEDAILALRDERPDGLVPGDGLVAAVVAGVDTQDNGFFFVIRAFGWGLEQESWLITHGFVRTIGALKEVIFEYEYKDAAGKVYPVQKTVQDAMGHRVKEMYDFVRRHPGKVQASKGAPGRKSQPYTLSKIDTYPNSKQLIPGGVILAHVDVNHYKDQLSSMLMVEPTDPGAFHLTAATTKDYAKQLCAEHIDEAKGTWACPDGKDNHYFDCEVAALVAADMLRVKFWKKQDSETQSRPQRRVRSNGVRR
ncbi:MAG: phage terminase large subunit family protein [Proteobacteria bacterium]|nr:phage terminase large subunit family protein [Pseudomonadota bacterium]MBU1640091.1 phage terminase large subunit family protein [Pseudomonadota bacterium]